MRRSLPAKNARGKTAEPARLARNTRVTAIRGAAFAFARTTQRSWRAGGAAAGQYRHRQRPAHTRSGNTWPVPAQLTPMALLPPHSPPHPTPQLLAGAPHAAGSPAAVVLRKKADLPGLRTPPWVTNGSWAVTRTLYTPACGVKPCWLPWQASCASRCAPRCCQQPPQQAPLPPPPPPPPVAAPAPPPPPHPLPPPP